MEFLNVNASHLLTLLVFAPTLGALLMCVLRGDERPEVNSALRNSYHARLRWFAGVVTLVTFALSILVLWVFDSSSASMQLVESYAWIPSFGVTYTIGVDGISLFLIVLTTFLMPLVVVLSLIHI